MYMSSDFPLTRETDLSHMIIFLYLGRLSQSWTSQKTPVLVHPIVGSCFSSPQGCLDGNIHMNHWQYIWNLSKLKYNNKMHGLQKPGGGEIIKVPILRTISNFSQLPRWPEIIKKSNSVLLPIDKHKSVRQASVILMFLIDEHLLLHFRSFWLLHRCHAVRPYKNPCT